MELYYGAFFDLTTCRGSIYQTEGPIPWTAIVEWARVYALGDDQFESLVYLIGKMDEVYLKFKTKKLVNEAKKGRKK